MSTTQRGDQSVSSEIYSMSIKGLLSPTGGLVFCGKNDSNMEGDSKRKTKKTLGDRILDLGNVLQPSWVRCPVCSCDEMDRVLLDNRFVLLLHVSLIFWALFFIKRTS